MADRRKPPPTRMIPQSMVQQAADASGSAKGRNAPTPSPSEPATGEYNAARAYTHFTKPDGRTRVLYQANGWIRVKLVLETAGPVVVGFNAELAPVLGGSGRQLETDEEWECSMTRGMILYIAAESVNRVGVTIEPIPWLQTISGQIGTLIDAASRLLKIGKR